MIFPYLVICLAFVFLLARSEETAKETFKGNNKESDIYSGYIQNTIIHRYAGKRERQEHSKQLLHGIKQPIPSASKALGRKLERYEENNKGKEIRKYYSRYNCNDLLFYNLDKAEGRKRCQHLQNESLTTLSLGPPSLMKPKEVKVSINEEPLMEESVFEGSEKMPDGEIADKIEEILEEEDIDSLSPRQKEFLYPDEDDYDSESFDSLSDEEFVSSFDTLLEGVRVFLPQQENLYNCYADSVSLLRYYLSDLSPCVNIHLVPGMPYKAYYAPIFVRGNKRLIGNPLNKPILGGRSGVRLFQIPNPESDTFYSRFNEDSDLEREQENTFFDIYNVEFHRNMIIELQQEEKTRLEGLALSTALNIKLKIINYCEKRLIDAEVENVKTMLSNLKHLPKNADTEVYSKENFYGLKTIQELGVLDCFNRLEDLFNDKDSVNDDEFMSHFFDGFGFPRKLNEEAQDLESSQNSKNSRELHKEEGEGEEEEEGGGGGGEEGEEEEGGGGREEEAGGGENYLWEEIQNWEWEPLKPPLTEEEVDIIHEIQQKMAIFRRVSRMKNPFNELITCLFLLRDIHTYIPTAQDYIDIDLSYQLTTTFIRGNIISCHNPQITIRAFNSLFAQGADFETLSQVSIERETYLGGDIYMEVGSLYLTACTFIFMLAGNINPDEMQIGIFVLNLGGIVVAAMTSMIVIFLAASEFKIGGSICVHGGSTTVLGGLQLEISGMIAALGIGKEFYVGGGVLTMIGSLLTEAFLFSLFVGFGLSSAVLGGVVTFLGVASTLHVGVASANESVGVALAVGGGVITLLSCYFLKQLNLIAWLANMGLFIFVGGGVMTTFASMYHFTASVVSANVLGGAIAVGGGQLLDLFNFYFDTLGILLIQTLGAITFLGAGLYIYVGSFHVTAIGYEILIGQGQIFVGAGYFVAALLVEYEKDGEQKVKFGQEFIGGGTELPLFSDEYYGAFINGKGYPGSAKESHRFLADNDSNPVASDGKVAFSTDQFSHISSSKEASNILFSSFSREYMLEMLADGSSKADNVGFSLITMIPTGTDVDISSAKIQYDSIYISENIDTCSLQEGAPVLREDIVESGWDIPEDKCYLIEDYQTTGKVHNDFNGSNTLDESNLFTEYGEPLIKALQFNPNTSDFGKSSLSIYVLNTEIALHCCLNCEILEDDCRESMSTICIDLEASQQKLKSHLETVLSQSKSENIQFNLDLTFNEPWTKSIHNSKTIDNLFDHDYLPHEINALDNLLLENALETYSHSSSSSFTSSKDISSKTKSKKFDVELIIRTPFEDVAEFFEEILSGASESNSPPLDFLSLLEPAIILNSTSSEYTSPCYAYLAQDIHLISAVTPVKSVKQRKQEERNAKVNSEMGSPEEALPTDTTFTIKSLQAKRFRPIGLKKSVGRSSNVHRQRRRQLHQRRSRLVQEHFSDLTKESKVSSFMENARSVDVCSQQSHSQSSISLLNIAECPITLIGFDLDLKSPDINVDLRISSIENVDASPTAETTIHGQSRRRLQQHIEGETILSYSFPSSTCSAVYNWTIASNESIQNGWYIIRISSSRNRENVTDFSFEGVDDTAKIRDIHLQEIVSAPFYVQTGDGIPIKEGDNKTRRLSAHSTNINSILSKFRGSLETISESKYNPNIVDDEYEESEGLAPLLSIFDGIDYNVFTLGLESKHIEKNDVIDILLEFAERQEDFLSKPNKNDKSTDKSTKSRILPELWQKLPLTGVEADRPKTVKTLLSLIKTLNEEARNKRDDSKDNFPKPLNSAAVDYASEILSHDDLREKDNNIKSNNCASKKCEKEASELFFDVLHRKQDKYKYKTESEFTENEPNKHERVNIDYKKMFDREHPFNTALRNIFRYSLGDPNVNAENKLLKDSLDLSKYNVAKVIIEKLNLFDEEQKKILLKAAKK